jgi:uncharacterized protein
VNPARIAILVAAGVVSGVINTLVGGGSIIVMPLLLDLPLAPKVADGSDQLAHLAGCIARLANYHRAKVLDWRAGAAMAVPVTLGAVIGAQTALWISNHHLKWGLIGAVLLAALLLLTNFRRLLDSRSGHGPRFGWRQTILLALVGLWTGALVIDGGVFLLMVLTLSVGYELTRANAIRAVLSLPVLFLSAGLFLLRGKADLLASGCLALGSAVGSWFSANFAIKEGSKVWVARLMFVLLAVELVRLALL